MSTNNTTLSKLYNEFQNAIPQRMRKENLPGLSVAITDANRTLWEAGFGITDRVRRLPVTSQTIFSLQSCSKMYTATVVLLAVQDGLLTLDAPIRDYLPGYTIQSSFEPHPEEKITLRHLLSHKAGFTHEAPVGNNFVYKTTGASFEDHIESIQRTWLRFPVGQRYSYSNLGIDLAGYILQQAAGIPFSEYVRTRLFGPLGLARSSFDYEVIAKDEDRAIGHDATYESTGMPIPLVVPMIPSGGIYSSASDAARYIRFHLSDGISGASQILDLKYLQEMYTIPWPVECQRDGYGLGIAVNRNHGTRRLTHSGGGFGFLSDMIWYPDIEVGIALLTNSVNHHLQWGYANQILDKILTLPEYQEKIRQISDAIPPSMNPALVKQNLESLKYYVGQYVGRVPDQCQVKSSEDGLTIRFGREKKGQPLFFYADDRAYIVNNEPGTPDKPNPRYQFMMYEDGKPAQMVSLLDGNVYDYNGSPSDPHGFDKKIWRIYPGNYYPKGSLLPFLIPVIRRDGHLYLKLYGIKLKLVEGQPGLFFTSTGEAVDFRSPEAMIAGLEVQRANWFQPLQFGVLLIRAFFRLKFTRKSA